MKHDFTDDVNGLIVGTHYGQAWVTYNGRKQGKTKYFQTEAQALEEMRAYIQQNSSGVYGRMVYPDKDGWYIHISGF